MNVLLSGRFGGLVVSNTQAFLDRCGVSEYSAQLRQAGGVTINDRNVSAKDYLGIVALVPVREITMYTMQRISACRKSASNIRFLRNGCITLLM